MTFGKIKYHFIILFLVFIAVINAQTTSFRALTMDNGLSNFVVTSFFKDSTGFIWIGTDNSLDRFDGTDFMHYTFPSADINKKRVKAICETYSGHLYIGNGLGLWHLSKGQPTPELLFPEMIDCGITTLKWDATEQKLYVGSEKGLFILKNNDKPQFVALDNNAISNNNHITGITFDENNLIWLTTRKGLCSYNKKSGEVRLYENIRMNSEQSFFAKITRIGKTLYMGSSKTGVISFDTEKKVFSKAVDLGSDIITDISGDGKDLIYVATDGNGVHFISHSKKQVVRTIRYDPKQKTGIRSNSVYSLLVDRDQIIWVGFYQAGLDYSMYQKQLFKTYSFPPFFDSEGLPVRTFIVRDNVKLIGTREGLYYINEAKKQVKSFNKMDLRSNLILSLIFHKGEYYIGTYGGGISVLNPQTMTVRPLRDDFTLLKGHGFHFEEDKSGNLWIATSGGLYRYIKEKNELTAFTSSNSQIYSGNVFYIYFDSSNKGWIATENGLCIYDPVSRSIKSNIFPKGFFNKEIIKVIHEDSNHNLLFCPDKGNIFVSDINMRNFSSLSITGRFRDRVFLSVLEDSKHNFWLGSDNGLISIRENEDGYHSFGFADGIPDPVFSADASYLSPDGKLWFGNAKGLVWIDVKRISKLDKPSFPVVITGLQVNGATLKGDKQEDFYAGKKITLSYNENNILFRFAGLQFTNPSTLIYEYKLEGFENEWQVLSSGRNEVLYNDLPPGNYTFVVRAEGNENSVTTLNFRIKSFFTIGFWIILVVILGLIYLFTNKLVHLYRMLKSKVSSFSAQISKMNENVSGSDEKYKYSKITEEECLAISKKLTEYIEKSKSYTNPELKIADIALAINCSAHSLSFIFNQYLNKNYYDFINEYRIYEFKRLVNETDISRYTISGLAEQCGFSSRASFFRSFKKLTGITPNEYIRSTGKNFHSVD